MKIYTLFKRQEQRLFNRALKMRGIQKYQCPLNSYWKYLQIYVVFQCHGGVGVI